MTAITIRLKLLIIAATALVIVVAGSAEATAGHGGEGGHGGGGWHGGGWHGGGGWREAGGWHGGWHEAGGWHGGGWHDNGRHFGWYKHGWGGPGWRGSFASAQFGHGWGRPGFVGPGTSWWDWRRAWGWSAAATDALFTQRASAVATMNAPDNMHSYAQIGRAYADNPSALRLLLTASTRA
jgi:hypothetical protein